MPNTRTLKKSRVHSVSDSLTACQVRFYAEQVGYVRDSNQSEEESRSAQIAALRSFFEELKSSSISYRWAGIVHDSDDIKSKGDPFEVSSQKPHAHIVLWVDPVNGRVTSIKVRTVLAALGRSGFRYNKETDQHLFEHGFTILNKRNRDHVRMFVYLTHETYEAKEVDHKHQYDRSEIYTNMGSDLVASLYSEYSQKLGFSQATVVDKVDIEQTALELGKSGKSFNQWWFSEVNPTVRLDTGSYSACLRAFTYGAEQYVESLSARPFDKLCIFISGAPGVGKTETSKQVLKSLGHKLYTIDGGKTGKFDSMDSTYTALLVSDTTVPDLHGMSDQFPMVVYKRCQGRPICAVNTMVITYNGDFRAYLNDMGYSGLNDVSKQALYSRFFHCEADLNGLRVVSGPTRFTEADKVTRLARMFMQFSDLYGQNRAQFMSSAHVDINDVLRSRGLQFKAPPTGINYCQDCPHHVPGVICSTCDR